MPPKSHELNRVDEYCEPTHFCNNRMVDFELKNSGTAGA